MVALALFLALQRAFLKPGEGNGKKISIFQKDKRRREPLQLLPILPTLSRRIPNPTGQLLLPQRMDRERLLHHLQRHEQPAVKGKRDIPARLLERKRLVLHTKAAEASHTPLFR